VEEVRRGEDNDVTGEVDVTQPFMEMGLDSVQMLALRSKIMARYECKLASSFLFQFNSIEAVAGQLKATIIGTSPQPKKEGDVSRPKALECKDDVIAIVGMACRFPGGNVDGFWNLLIDGRSGIRDVPSDRWWWMRNAELDGVGERAGYLDDVDAFDAKLFRVSPAEAELMDPQQRLLLET